jgi:replicative DNA helicase Mcm
MESNHSDDHVIDDSINDLELTVDEIETFKEFLRGNRNDVVTRQPITKYNERVKEIVRNLLIDSRMAGGRSLMLDLDDLNLVNPGIVTAILNNPISTLKRLSKALEDVIVEHSSMGSEFIEFGDFHVRPIFKSSDETTGFNDVNAAKLGKLITVTGVVTTTTREEPSLQEAVWVCAVCSEKIKIERDNFETYVPPPKACVNMSCSTHEKGKGKKTKWNFKRYESRYVDLQWVMLQEAPENKGPGEQPDTVKIAITDDLVRILKPGIRAIISGIHIGVPTDNLDKESYGYSTFKSHLFCTSIDVQNPDENDRVITEEREKEIIDFVTAKRENKEEYFKYMIDQIAPQIYGHDHIKLSLIAMLFGGQNYVDPHGKWKIRGTINVLLLGDPGVAKTQMLRSMESLSPRFIYASGQSSTKAGLTAAVNKGEYGPELHAGAVVLADTGIAAIDEFDKMRPEDISALHEMMESQTVTVNKWSFHETLNARTSIAAAANPKHGRIIPVNAGGETIRKQIDKIPFPILSRFDLIWMMPDKPNKENDGKMVDRMFEIRKPENVRPTGKFLMKSSENSGDEADSTFFRDLIIILKRRADENPLGISTEAEKILKKHYLNIRQEILDEETGMIKYNIPIPITPRQLESASRFAEAFAKADMSEEVKAYHAEKAIELVTKSMEETMKNEDGEIDPGSMSTGHDYAELGKKEMMLMVLIEEQKKKNADDWKTEHVPLDKFKEAVLNGMKNLSDRVFDKKLKELVNEKLVEYVYGNNVRVAADGLTWIGY